MIRPPARARQRGIRLVLAGAAVLGALLLVVPVATGDDPASVTAAGPDPSEPPRATVPTTTPVTTEPPADVAPPQRPRLPPEGKAIFGVSTQSASLDAGELAAFEVAAGRHPNLLLVSVGWAFEGFDGQLLADVAEAGMVPMIGWEPWDYRESATDQPVYALQQIAAGAFDDHILTWARGVRDHGGPVVIRFAHEMNGDWYPWAEAVNGNQPGDYVAAWRHVRRIFDDVGARNALWVWSPNITYYRSGPLEPLYPGDEWVDWVGIVGYYGHGRAPGNVWRDFEEIYGATVDEIRGFTAKPILLTEVAATEVGGFKEQWITHFFDELARRPDIIGFVWYERVKESDWRIVSSEAARSAFAAGVADPRYDWSPGGWPAG